MSGNDVLNFLPFPNGLYEREKHCDDSVLNVKAPISSAHSIYGDEDNTYNKKDNSNRRGTKSFFLTDKPH